MTWGEQNTETEAHAQLDYAVSEKGINFIDTAELYPVPAKEETQGRTDRYIGSWLRGVKREDVTIATKVCGYSDRLRWFREAEGQPTRVSAAQIAESVDRSLARLGTDYIDLLQLHWPDRYVPLFGAGAYDAKEHRQDTVPIEEQLEALARLRDAGKVKFVGLSNETSFGVMRFVGAAEASQNASLPRVVSIQNAYSLNVRGAFETDLVETCAPHNCNVSLLAYSPLAGGTLTGKYLEDESDPRARMNAYTNYMNRYRNQRAREATAAYVALARAHGLTPTQLALGFCRSRPFMGSTIVGATSLEQLKENIETFEMEALTPDVLEAIDEIYSEYRDPAN
eukprot:PRCOL_00006218-RA